jgi:hypothetical protein
MPATPEQRSLAGRIGAHSSWAKTADRAARTEPARRASLARFEQQVDPDGVMTPEQRTAAADSARRAYMSRLSLLAAQARQNNNAA